MTRRTGFLALVVLAVTASAVWGVVPVTRRVRRAVLAVTRTHTRARPTEGRSVLPTAPVLSTLTAGLPAVGANAARGNFTLLGEAAPRSLQVIAVPVPAGLGSGPVDFIVTPAGLAEVLSDREGHLDAGAESRVATLVSRVPSNASAGTLTVAEVLFQGDSGSAVVTVDLVVSRIRRIVLRPVQSSLALQAGQRGRLRLQVQNLGNGADTLQIVSEAPAAWYMGEGAALILQPGEQEEVTLDLRAPALNGFGIVPIHIKAMSDTLQVASVQVGAEILPDAAEERRQRGLLVTGGIATVVGSPGSPSQAFGLTVDGPLTPEVALSGRFMATNDRSRFDAYSMARVGYFLDASYLTAAGRSWQTTVGRTGYSFAPIFGWNAYGLGGSGTLNVGRWAFGGLAAQERTAGRTGGTQIGGRVMHPFGPGQLSVTAVHLEQTFFFQRALDAGGLGYSFSPRRGTSVSAEGGWRQADSSQGATGALTFMSNSMTHHIEFYAAHAPGGSAGFARATDEFSAGVWERLGQKWSVRTYGYSMFDDPGKGSVFHSRGLTGGPTVALGNYSSLDLSVNARSTEADGPQGTSSGNELLTTLTGRSLIGQLAVRAAVGAGQTGRDQVLLGINSSSSGSRLVLRGGADLNTQRGIFQLDASLERNDAATGQVPSLGYLALQATSLRLFNSSAAPRLDISSWKNIYAGAPPGAVGVRIGTQAALPGEFMLTVNAERNPYLRQGSSTPWIASIKLERGLSFPALRRPTARGRVFDDLNGDGRQDDGEPGMQGVLVRRGDHTAITRADGGFLFYDPLPATFAPRVESSALAMGQVAPELPRDTSRHDWALPILRTARLVVRFTPTPDSLARVPVTPLSDLTALAADSTGAIWIAHADSTGAATFDALPPGRYTFTIDFSRSTERLRMLQSAPVVEVAPGATLPDLPIRFGFRPVRVLEVRDPDGGGAGR